MSRTHSKPIYGNASTGRARKVITRSGAIFRGKFPSRKNGRMVHHEGLIELDACYLFEMHPLILKYQEQPTTLKYPGGHRLRDYTPDFQLTLRTGEVVLVEIKHSEILARKEVREKYDNIAAHLKSEETGYVIITEDIIRLEPRLTTMKKAFAALTYPRPTDDFICTAISPLLVNEFTTISELDDELKNRGLTTADLLANGYLTYDLDTEMSSSTTFSILKEPDHEWLRISEKFPF